MRWLRCPLSAKHMETMECYACHADWGTTVLRLPTSPSITLKNKTDVDWIKTANARGEDGLSADYALGTNGLKGPGKVSETRSYLRWETPILGINGEGRVTPLMPGCQVITTVIDKDGNTIVENEIWDTAEAKGSGSRARSARTLRVVWHGRVRAAHNNPKNPRVRD